jgi:hypothetical protein
MADEYFMLPADEKREALAVAASKSGRPIHLLEKDVWVVWAFRELFASPFGNHLVFKGGTSLSKAYGAIDRFSEDIDITYEIGAIAPDLVEQFPDGLPRPRSQQNRWTEKLRKRLDEWVASRMLPYMLERLGEADKHAQATAAGDTILISYTPLAKGTGYIAPRVIIEFGARSTGTPFETRCIVADATPYLPDVAFPECSVRTMRAERTFWEKASAIHVFCRQGAIRGERFSRHWYDLAQLDDAGFADRALADRDLARKVAEHKAIFFLEKSAAGEVIDYRAAVERHLQLIPTGEARAILAADYRKMIEDGLLPDGAKTSKEVIAQCGSIEHRANRPVAEPPMKSCNL